MRRAHRGWRCQRRELRVSKWRRMSAMPRDSLYSRSIVRRSHNRPTAVMCCEKWESHISTSKWSLGCGWRHTEPLVPQDHPPLPRNSPLLSPELNPSSAGWISPEMDACHKRISHLQCIILSLPKSNMSAEELKGKEMVSCALFLHTLHASP